MKKMSFYLIFLSLMACKKKPSVDCNSPTNDLALSKELIIGDWQWVKSRSLQSGYISRPDSTKYQVMFSFKSNGIMEQFVDGNLVDTSSYEIAIEKKYSTFYGDTLRNVLAIKRRLVKFQKHPLMEYYVPIRICNDSLYLFYESYAWHTAGDNYFSRK
jgi:hypothetical protein